MTLARDILEASPARTELGIDAVVDAIEACMTSAQVCTACANACLGEDDVSELRTCTARCERCADLCTTTVRVLSRPFGADHFVTHRTVHACVRACSLSAEECERHASHHRHCEICARACRACVKACSALLEEEAFDELKKLAGG
jgi:hypothetical protein